MNIKGRIYALYLFYLFVLFIVRQSHTPTTPHSTKSYPQVYPQVLLINKTYK